MNNNNNDGPWGSGGNNPWGGGSSDNRDLENSIKKAKEKFSSFKLGRPRNYSFLIIECHYIKNIIEIQRTKKSSLIK